MKIVMFTNTYLPHVGGVANSVKTFEDEFRLLGHQVKIVAPEFPGAEKSTENVMRVPAIQNFNGTDFSVRLAVPGAITAFLDDFQPDVIHSHHPFLLGDAALRAGHERNLPIIFTHHTLYEKYTHYVPMDSPALKRAAIRLAVEYANLCSIVIAPSESVQTLLEERGVESPIVSIPTGIDLERFRNGNGQRFRKQLGIPPDAKVIGHVGRLAEEKNLAYLAEAIGRCLRENPQAVALIVGSGDAKDATESRLQKWADSSRVYMAGKRTGRELVNAYAAMDIFAFSSHSETQGMVLAEAMAAGKPVVALDAPGVREIMCFGENGYMIDSDAGPELFARSLGTILEDETLYRPMSEQALITAREFSKRRCARKILSVYERVQEAYEPVDEIDPWNGWDSLLRRIEIEWHLLSEKMAVAAATMIPETEKEVELV